MQIWAIINDFDVCLTIWVLLYAHFMHFCVIYLTWWCPYHHPAGSCIRREFPCLLMFFKCVIVHDFSATLLEACALIKPGITDDWAAEDKINVQKRNYLPEYALIYQNTDVHSGYGWGQLSSRVPRSSCLATVPCYFVLFVYNYSSILSSMVFFCT